MAKLPVPNGTVEIQESLSTKPVNLSASDGSGHPEPRKEVSGLDGDDLESLEYLTGWRLYLLTFAICLSLLLSTLETTIVSTSLVSITNSLQGFDLRDWVVTSYLLTYTGFLIIYAKFSNIFGRKALLLLGLGIFTVFSILCGAAQTILGLIIFRAFQGIGGSGIYSMVMVISPYMVPYEQFGKYMAIVSSVFAVASILGPILGGAINDSSQWRWVFLLNAPAGVLAIALVIIFLPSDSSSLAVSNHALAQSIFSKKTFRRLDLMGTILSLSASVLLVFALEQAGTRLPWNSAAIMTAFTLSGKTSTTQEPIFPLRLLRDRIFVGMILNVFFTGFPFMAVIINLPQRFQAVNGTSPFNAGIRLLPLLLCTPFASGLSGLLVTNFKIAPVYIIFTGASLQLLGVGLVSSIPDDLLTIQAAQYGYEVLMGLGFGLGLSTLLIFVPLVVSKEDLAVAMGAITQIRVLGGTMGLAICTTILNNKVGSLLPLILDPHQIHAISDSLSSINTLDEQQRDATRRVFAKGYHEQMRIMTYVSAAVLAVSFLMLEKQTRRAPEEQNTQEGARR